MVNIAAVFNVNKLAPPPRIFRESKVSDFFFMAFKA